MCMLCDGFHLIISTIYQYLIYYTFVFHVLVSVPETAAVGSWCLVS